MPLCTAILRANASRSDACRNEGRLDPWEVRGGSSLAAVQFCGGTVCRVHSTWNAVWNAHICPSEVLLRVYAVCSGACRNED